MKIAIVSDTHGNVANFKKVVAWLNKKNIQLILHAGDIGSPESLKESLADFKGELLGVLGNMDKDYKTCPVKSREAGILPEAKLFNRVKIEEYNKIKKVKIEEKILKTKIKNKSIAITHKPEDARVLAESGEFDLVFYGHTHKPWEDKIGNCRIINPGELAGQIFKPCFAIYDTDTEKLELKILQNI